MLDRLESAWRAATHALELVVQGVVSVDPRWLAAGVSLYLLNQVVRTRGWFNIIRAAYPDAHELRWPGRVLGPRGAQEGPLHLLDWRPPRLGHLESPKRDVAGDRGEAVAEHGDA